MYILDTNIISYYLKGDKQVVRKWLAADPEQIATTIFNFTELSIGMYLRPEHKDKYEEIGKLMSLMPLIDFDQIAADIFAKEYVRLRKAGTPIEDFDLLIASICIATKATLVTHNTKHFARIKNLKLEDWKNK